MESTINQTTTVSKTTLDIATTELYKKALLDREDYVDRKFITIVKREDADRPAIAAFYYLLHNASESVRLDEGEEIIELDDELTSDLEEQYWEGWRERLIDACEEVDNVNASDLFRVAEGYDTNGHGGINSPERAVELATAEHVAWMVFKNNKSWNPRTIRVELDDQTADLDRWDLVEDQKCRPWGDDDSVAKRVAFYLAAIKRAENQ
jgi:hypothetical protein